MAGKFSIRRSTGEIVKPPLAYVRSGPQSAEVIEIKPGKVAEMDAYDYGIGVSPDRSLYAFNTSSFEAELRPGIYIVDYSLILTHKQIEDALKSYGLINTDPNEIWIGEIELKGTGLILK